MQALELYEHPAKVPSNAGLCCGNHRNHPCCNQKKEISTDVAWLHLKLKAPMIIAIQVRMVTTIELE